MALVFQGNDKAAIEGGVIMKAEFMASGGSFQDMGFIQALSSGSIVPITTPCDPADSQMVQALRIECTLIGMQTDKAKELTNLDDTAGTGLFDTEGQLRLTLESGRTLTFGAATGYPLRMNGAYNLGGSAGMNTVTYTISHVEPYTEGVAGKFSA